MCVFMYIRLCIFRCVHNCVYISECIGTGACVHTDVRVHVWELACACKRMCVCERTRETSGEPRLRVASGGNVGRPRVSEASGDSPGRDSLRGFEPFFHPMYACRQEWESGGSWVTNLYWRIQGTTTDASAMQDQRIGTGSGLG